MARKLKGSIDTSVVGTKVGAMITPEQLAASGTEHGHQVAFFQWVATKGRKVFGTDADLLFAVPNGGDRQAHVGAAMKAEGVKPGVPDVCWPMPQWDPSMKACVFAGLFIELKKPDQRNKKDGGRSEHQVKWHKRLRAQGYAVVLAYGWQAMAWAAYLYWKGDLRMKDEDALFADAVDQPPVVG